MPSGWLLLADLFDAVILDHHVGQQLAAHLVEILVADTVRDIQLDHPSDANVLHAAEAQPLQRVVNGAALRIEHARLEADEDANFHERCLRVYRGMSRSQTMAQRAASRKGVLAALPRSNEKLRRNPLLS